MNTLMSVDMTVSYSVLPSRLSPTVTRVNESWVDFLSRFKMPTRTKESFTAFQRSEKRIRDQIKDVGGFVGGYFRNNRRKKAELIGRRVVCLDMDHLPVDWQHQLDAFLEKADLRCFYHTSHSHHPERPRARLVVLLDSEVSGEAYEALARKFAEQIGMDFFDDTTYEASRLMYFPSCSADGDYVFKSFDGSPLCVASTLALYEDWRDVMAWPLSTRDVLKGKQLIEKSKKTLEDPLQKNGVVGAFCRVYSIDDAICHFLATVYSVGSVANRYSFVKGSTFNGAVVYENKWLFSHHESDPVSGREVNAFDLVRIHLFGAQDKDSEPNMPVNKLPSYIAMLDFANNDKAVKVELLKSKIEGFVSLAGVDEENFDWMQRLDTDQKGNIKTHLVNASILMSEDSLLKGCIAFNALKQNVVRLKCLPWASCKDKKGGDVWSDNDDLQIVRYFKDKYQTVFTEKAINAGVNLVAYDNRFDPVKDYLQSLTWDGVERIDTAFYDFLGVEKNAYTLEASRLFFIAAVKRVYEPGCKWDYAHVLEGAQGIGKSSFVNILASDAFFNDSVHKFEGKESVEALQGAWICELAELQGLNKAEVESIKSFITRKEDRARMAYARNVSVSKRRCVLVGTTNSAQYLRDSTGNRRFLPLMCSKTLDFDGLKKARDQLWAEAVSVYKKGGAILKLSSKAEASAEAAQASRMEDDAYVAIIRAWLDKPISKNHWRITDDSFSSHEAEEMMERDKTCSAEIWTDCLSGKVDALTRAKQKQIADAMCRIGWEWKKVSLGSKYGKVWGYKKCE